MDEIIKAAEKLIQSVEFDVNGTNGKGGNGGLTSNDTLQAAGDLRVKLSRFKRGK